MTYNNFIERYGQDFQTILNLYPKRKPEEILVILIRVYLHELDSIGRRPKFFLSNISNCLGVNAKTVDGIRHREEFYRDKQKRIATGGHCIMANGYPKTRWIIEDETGRNKIVLK